MQKQFTVVALYVEDSYGQPQHDYITWHAVDAARLNRTQCGQPVPSGSVTRPWSDDVWGPMENICTDCRDLYPIVYDGTAYPEDRG